jgi:hypothetical protein
LSIAAAGGAHDGFVLGDELPHAHTRLAAAVLSDEVGGNHHGRQRRKAKAHAHGHARAVTPRRSTTTGLPLPARMILVVVGQVHCKRTACNWSSAI